jgi:hypothetical protein
MDTTVHPSLPGYVVEQTQAEIADLEATLQALGPREKLAERVLAAQAAVKQKEAAIVAAHGVPLHVDRSSGSMHHHPALRDVRRALDSAFGDRRRYDETQRRLDGLRRFLETGSRLDRPHRAYAAPSEVGRIAQDGRGLRLTAGADGVPRLERVGDAAPKVCEMDGPAGVRRRRARHN